MAKKGGGESFCRTIEDSNSIGQAIGLGVKEIGGILYNPVHSITYGARESKKGYNCKTNCSR